MSMLLKILQRPVKIKPGLLLIDSAALIVCSSREDRIAIAARVLSMCHWEIMRGFLLKKNDNDEMSVLWLTRSIENV